MNIPIPQVVPQEQDLEKFISDINASVKKDPETYIERLEEDQMDATAIERLIGGAL